MAAGKTVTGPVMVDDWGTAMQLQNATLVKRTIAGALYRPHGRLRLRILAFGLYAGRLAGRPRRRSSSGRRRARQGLAGTLQVAVALTRSAAPRPRSAVRNGAGGKHYTFKTMHGRSR